jgi:hypothetical protein
VATDAEATYRVEIEKPNVHRMTVPGCESLGRDEAIRIARQMLAQSSGPVIFHVRNERTGWTPDEFRRQIGQCPRCGAAMHHTRLWGYCCPRCDR